MPGLKNYDPVADGCQLQLPEDTMSEYERLSVGGYLFSTEKDARLAEAEQKKIEYLEARIDYSRPQSILLVYEKSIHERIFRTPIGFEYLQKLRSFLLEQPEIAPDVIADIELYCNFGGDSKERIGAKKKHIDTPKDTEKTKQYFIISFILNILLVVAIMVMFNIALKSPNPNILNYERAITDKYAAWEEELTERERVVREKEKELK